MRRIGERSGALLALALVAAAAAAYAAYALLVRDGPMPAGSPGGHALGVVGYLLMLFAAFGYSWRKQPRRAGPGSGREWMQAHVVAGLLGPALVLLHTGFAFRGLAGVTTWLALVVVASGVVGRYVYTAMPPAPGAVEDEALRRLDEEIEALELEIRDERSDEAGGGAAVLTPTRAAIGLAIEARQAMLRRLRAEQGRRVAGLRAGSRRRRVLALWWVLHVPVSAAMLLLGLVHALAALYYATLVR